MKNDVESYKSLIDELGVAALEVSLKQDAQSIKDIIAKTKSTALDKWQKVVDTDQVTLNDVEVRIAEARTLAQVFGLAFS